MTDDAREPGDGAGAQGPEPALRIRMGSKPGASLRVKALGWDFVGKKGHVVDVTISEFKEVAVATTGPGTREGDPTKTNRCVVLVPSEDESSIEWHGFYVRGRFRIADKVWNPSLAHQMFKEFQPS